MADTPRQLLATRIPTDLHDRLKAYSQETGISIQRLVTDAIVALLNERGAK
jgi:hypothetical protein